jgi:hypothetical protein
MHSKIYILIKDWVDVGHAVNTAGHASLILYLRNKDNPELKEWIENSFRKVTCKVTEEEFERAKQFEGYEIVTEMQFDNQEVALIFLPRIDWPKFFKYLKLYK